jgi:branched-chain amino acid transport system ATP-binding protein
VLEIVGVNKSFGSLQALRDLSFTIEENTIHGIIGPNGSGKTTLFNCISGLIPLDSGRITFNGFEISGLGADAIARLGIRRTFQAAKLAPSLTVLENVKSGVPSPQKEKALEKEALAILDFVGMGYAADSWAADLVWAERQFVQIARAMISKPKVLLLDEPAAGMAPRETDLVGELIGKIKAMGITVAVVSHDVKMLLAVAERVTALNLGGKIAEGRPDQIRRDPLVLEAYLGTEE